MLLQSAGDTDAGQSAEAALKLAEQISKNAPLSLQLSKRVLRQSQGMTDEEFWAFQNADTAAIFSSEDAREGAVAFAEKREPNWKGR